jgi:hypothetical protein
MLLALSKFGFSPEKELIVYFRADLEKINGTCTRSDEARHVAKPVT